MVFHIIYGIDTKNKITDDARPVALLGQYLSVFKVH